MVAVFNDSAIARFQPQRHHDSRFSRRGSRMALKSGCFVLNVVWKTFPSL